ncbi:MAG: hypothetical protein K2X84_13860, partial [Beijerinckiaceae bacterium]|nr:hypothetical protein [Beijerinckiaceae bacterium]
MLFIAAAPAAQAQCQEQPRSREWGEVVKRGECINRRQGSPSWPGREAWAGPSHLNRSLKVLAWQMRRSIQAFGLNRLSDSPASAESAATRLKT